jgi:hypothetical protein
MVLLLSRQTPEERSARTTCESNGRGFNINDAEFGTYLAHWVLGLTTMPYKSWQVSRKPSDAYVAGKVGEFLSKTYISGRPLTGYHLQRGREMGTYYWRQTAALLAPPAPKPRITHIWGTDMSHMLRQFDKFQQFA